MTSRGASAPLRSTWRDDPVTFRCQIHCIEPAGFTHNQPHSAELCLSSLNDSQRRGSASISPTDSARAPIDFLSRLAESEKVSCRAPYRSPSAFTAYVVQDPAS